MSEGGSNPWWVVLGSGAISGAFLAINNWLNARGGWLTTKAAREKEQEEQEERARQKVLDSLDGRQTRFVQRLEEDLNNQIRRREAADNRADDEERSKSRWRWVAVERGHHLREAKQLAESAMRLLPGEMRTRLGPLPPWWDQWIRDPEDPRPEHLPNGVYLDTAHRRIIDPHLPDQSPDGSSPTKS